MVLKILDLNIENKGYDEILKTIESNISAHHRTAFSYCNVYVALRARREREFAKDLTKFTSLYSDGVGIYWASKFLYGKHGLKERINGTDLYYKILNLAEKQNHTVFFFGGSSRAKSYLKQKHNDFFPNLKIGGIFSKEKSSDEDLFEKMNQSNSDILFLGLGTPYQEKWIANFGKKCNIPIQIACGSGIEFLSSVYRRAPKLMRVMGLEWLFRLFLEPKRLWKRYLIGIPTFIFLIIKQKLLY